MEIDYKDVNRVLVDGPEFLGTKIIIVADDKKEARKIDAILAANRKRLFGSSMRNFERNKLEFTMIAHDGFLVSEAEVLLTGNRRAWQYKGFRKPYRKRLNI